MSPNARNIWHSFNSIEKAQIAMQWSDIPRSPSSRTLRQFAVLWIVFFGGLAILKSFNPDKRVIATVFAALTVTIGILGLIKPQAIRFIFVGWMILVFPVGWLISRRILALVFYGVFTPIALVFKLIGRDVLSRTPRQGVLTYWAPKQMTTNASSYLRPF